MLESWPTQHVRLNRHTKPQLQFYTAMSKLKPRGRESLKWKKPRSRRQSQTSPCLAGRPAPMDKRCTRVSSATAGRPAPAPAHTGARTKHSRGSRGGPSPAPRSAALRGTGSGGVPDPPRAQAPPQNGGHLWQRLRSVPAPGGLLGAHPPRDSAPSRHIGAALPLCPPRPPPGCWGTPALKMADIAPHSAGTLLAPPQPRESRRPNRSRAERDSGPSSTPPRAPTPRKLSPRVPAEPRDAARKALARSRAHLHPRRSATAQWGRTKALRAFIALRHPAGRSPGCGGGSAEPGRGHPRPAAAGEQRSRARRAPSCQERGTGRGRERREKSGSGPWERSRALFASCASSRRIEALCGVLRPILGSSARERRYWI